MAPDLVQIKTVPLRMNPPTHELNADSYQSKAEGLHVLVLDGGAVGREPLGDDEEDLAGLVVELVPGEEDAAAE